MPTNRAMKSSLLILAAGLFGMLSDARADGFIVVERPFLVRPGHFPFAPLEVTSHHVEVKIDSQVAVTSIDQEFYNPNDQRLEGTFVARGKGAPNLRGDRAQNARSRTAGICRT